MEHFIAVALAHFLALLIPGADFFLIARTAMISGWAHAVATCFGIALSHGIYIGAAFTGLSLVSQPSVLVLIQLAGGVFLAYTGTSFLRAKIDLADSAAGAASSTSWTRCFVLGMLTALLNPKNALFYLSLAAAVSAESAASMVLYGVWMFLVVLAWDLAIAIALGNQRAIHRLGRFVPWLAKGAGLFLILFGVGLLATALQQLI